MNDLERDLQELFDRKATGLDVHPAAPEAVLRRGRRRQVGVAVAGGVGALAAIAVAAGITLAMLDDGGLEQIPGVPSGPYAERTAVIERYEVTAPAGWTLLDGWGFSPAIAVGSTACSTFSSVGAPVEAGGGGGDGGATDGGADADDGAATGAPSDDGCVSEPTDPSELPAGLPVLQLSTFDHGPLSLVCDAFSGLTEQASTTLPANGAAVFVTAFPEVLDAEQVQARLREACAATPDIGSIVQGSSMTWVTATFAGAEADPALVAVAADAVRDLGDHGTTEPTEPPVPGVGYVVASGSTGDERWHVTAGALLEEGAAAWVTAHDTDGRVTASIAQPAGENERPRGSAIDVGDAAVAVGMIPSPGGDATWEVADARVSLDQALFPAGMAMLQTDLFLGSVAFGEVPGTSGALVVESSDEDPPTVNPTPTSDPRGEALDVTVEDGVATGTIEAFGRTITITVDRDGLVRVPGEDATVRSLIRNGGTRVDLEGGSLAMRRLRADAEGPYVVADDGTVFAGSWIEIPSYLASPDRIWFVPLDGAGAGMEYQGDGLGIATTWPTHEELLPGDIPAAGAQHGVTSWALRWTEDDCPVFEVVDAANEANLGTMADCILPYDPAVTPTYIGGIYGEDVATIAVTGPLGFSFETDGPAVVQCGTDFNEPGWDDTGVCVIVMETDITVEFQVTAMDTRDPVGEPVAIRVEDGEITTTSSGHVV